MRYSRDKFMLLCSLTKVKTDHVLTAFYNATFHHSYDHVLLWLERVTTAEFRFGSMINTDRFAKRALKALA